MTTLMTLSVIGVGIGCLFCFCYVNVTHFIAFINQPQIQVKTGAKS